MQDSPFFIQILIMNNKSLFLSTVFFLLLLLAYPLGFGKVLFGSMPYFGDVPLFDLNALPFFAVALIFLRPGFLSGLWRKDRFIAGATAGDRSGNPAGCRAAIPAAGPPDRFCIALFYLLLPLAGCAWPIAGNGSSRSSLPGLPLLL